VHDGADEVRLWGSGQSHETAANGPGPSLPSGGWNADSQYRSPWFLKSEAGDVVAAAATNGMRARSHAANRLWCWQPRCAFSLHLAFPQRPCMTADRTALLRPAAMLRARHGSASDDSVEAVRRQGRLLCSFTLNSLPPSNRRERPPWRRRPCWLWRSPPRLESWSRHI
jgi:hypothetical protein